MVKSQRCSNVNFTTSFLQHCYNVISQCCVHVVAQRCGLRCSNVAGMLFSQRCKITTLYNVVLTLCVCWVISYPSVSTRHNIENFGLAHSVYHLLNVILHDIPTINRVYAAVKRVPI